MKKISNQEQRIRNFAGVKWNNSLNFTACRTVEGAMERARFMRHRSVCRQITAWLDKHPGAPCSFVIAAGVQADAYKQEAFEKGYRKFDAMKVETVMEMGGLYNLHHGISGAMDDVTWRLMTRYYDKVSKSLRDFKLSLAASPVMGSDAGRRGMYRAQCMALGIPVVAPGKYADTSTGLEMSKAAGRYANRGTAGNSMIEMTNRIIQ